MAWIIKHHNIGRLRPDGIDSFIYIYFAEIFAINYFRYKLYSQEFCYLAESFIGGIFIYFAGFADGIIFCIGNKY